MEEVVAEAEEDSPRIQTSSFKPQEEEVVKHQEPYPPYSQGTAPKQKYLWKQSGATFASMPELSQ